MTTFDKETAIPNSSAYQTTSIGLARVEKVAAMLDCGVSTVWAYTAAGKLPKPIRASGLTRWRISDIEAHIYQLHEKANAA